MTDTNNYIEYGVNFDYILTLKKNGKHVKVARVPIARRVNEIEALLSMLDNDVFDITNMYGIMLSTYGSVAQDFKYCFGCQYGDKLYGDLTFPKVDCIAYMSYLAKQKERIKQQEEWGNITLYKKIKISLENKKRADKKEYLLKALAYIAASDYENALEQIKTNSTILAYSSEVHGWYRPIYNINEDISIQLKTNFCYGNSTRFLVVVRYKGIELLPYGEWVSYYFARIDELIGCTRSYEVNRGRWQECMDFLEGFINSAIDNPEDFVKKEVMIEVDTLVKGLEKVFKTDSCNLQREMKVNSIGVSGRYIGIRAARMASDREIDRYNISPTETTMIYRMEKICCALKFLDSLRRLEEIYREVTVAIDTILNLNLAILPEIDDTIPSVEVEIKEVELKIKPKEKRKELIESKIEKYEKRLNRLYKNVSSMKEKEEIEISFRDSNPLYGECENELNQLCEEIHSLNIELFERKALLKRLVKYKELIKMYVNG